MNIYDIIPCTKPRMTRSDKWKKRPPVLRYRAFADRVRALGLTLPDHGYHVTFVLPMPKSWSKHKREAMSGKPHQQKPDVDNLCKALFDALFKDDSHIWDCRITKIWGESGRIMVGECG